MSPTHPTLPEASMSTPDAASSPIGSTHREGMRRRSRDPVYQNRLRELAPYERVARMVIARRMSAGWTQQELAERMGTSHSVISRIESGRRATSVQTLIRLAEAFGTHLVVGFDDDPRELGVDDTTRQLAAVN
jgi:ribosome-binding protein aMBF1 (putative translation factor)